MDVSAVDLFCGAGGLTNGLEAAGIPVEAGFDVDEDCEYAYESNNHAKFVPADLAEVARRDPAEIGDYLDEDADVTLIAGCAPCQPFSPLNHGSDSTEHAMYGMLSVFGEIVKHVQPDFVVMENVYEVRDDPVYHEFVRQLQELGYNVNRDKDKRVYCPDFDIPQKRRRWVALASKQGTLDLGEPICTDPTQYKSVEEQIGHLPPLEAGETHPDDWLHTARSLDDINVKRVSQSKPGGTWRDWDEELRLECHTKESGSTYDSVYGRMRPEDPAPTITTQFYNLGSGRFGHYDQSQNRAISLREGALIQTFPADYEFAESLEDIGISKCGQLIGNAVPPELGRVIGDRVIEFLDGKDRQEAITDY
ncbi:DNA cytosine methyltransferase [Salinigranum halophilum]|uniref:DNA cytosine methyltransferase n=1 Tax=Salinigranum halophilum TaxID=2565931 RepID=UPI0010A8B1BA|nr:DNA cytosine methyltransferase [Salinigranum halophilum]